MKTKKEIVDDWLPRYTGTALKDYGDYIILANFPATWNCLQNGKKQPLKVLTGQCPAPLPAGSP